MINLYVFLPLIFLIAVIVAAPKIAMLAFSRLGLRVNDCKVAAVALAAMFLWLVANGVTGSSMEVGLNSTHLVSHDMKRLLNTKPRAIRSDEWLVSTALAISQFNHNPPYPITNNNLGPDGQNMLVVTMTGVPVAHISAIGRPATWGFFFFGLEKALSWYWWLPIFGCLLSLWALFAVTFALKWGPGLALAAIFTFSSYSSAWSFWPAYLVMFASAGFIAVLGVFRSRHLSKSVGWGALLTLSIVGFTLVLYPAWQVVVGYLYLFLLVGVFLKDRLWGMVSRPKVIILIIAGGVAAAVLYAWWVDARGAILAMMHTVYPGERASITGGGLPLWSLAEGLFNTTSLFTSDLPYTNESESSSFLFLWLPILALILRLMWLRKRIDPVCAAILLFVCIGAFYQYIGVPRWFAEYSLWGRSTPTRAVLAMGLAEVFLIAWLLNEMRQTRPSVWSDARLLEWVIVVATVGSTAFLFTLMPVEWRGKPFYWSLAGGTITILILTVAFLENKRRLLLTVWAVWTCSISFAFNPFAIAPSHVTSAGELNLMAGQDDGVGRVLFMESQIPAMILLAADVPVLNGVFFYPQKSVWSVLDPGGVEERIHNRYQHLTFSCGEDPSIAPAAISSPTPDQVHVKVSCARFQFDALPLDLVISRSPRELSHNPSLRLERKVGGDFIFRVHRR